MIRFMCSITIHNSQKENEGNAQSWNLKKKISKTTFISEYTVSQIINLNFAYK